jgi:HlyD family secretion protein
MIRDTSAQDEIIQPARTSNRFRVIVASVVGLMVIAILVIYPSFQSWSSAEYSVARERVRLSTVNRGALVRDISAQGKVVASIKPTLFSSATGVATLFVKAGDSVLQGEPIARIDSPELESLLQQESSALQSAETEYNRRKIQAKKTELQNQQTIDLAEVALIAARRELRRAEQAHSKDAISEFDYDKANDDVATAELKFKHATQDAQLQTESLQFELETSQLQIQTQTLRVDEFKRQVADLEVRSPVDGIVGNLAIQNKDAVSKNQALVTVVDLSAFEIELMVPDSFAEGLEVGLDAEISYTGKKYPGLVVAISPEVINSQISAKVRFADAMPDHLKQNQRVSARILLESRDNVLVVKRGPFLESGGGRFAYIVDGDLATKQQIQIGATSVSSVEILSGLTEGQTVIVSSSRDFEDADVVYLTN